MSAAASSGESRTDAAAAAIRHHYDIGNDFYRLWLDPSLTYSCAMPQQPTDTLAAAQERKLRHHLDAVHADRARAVLDIGCGWGSLLSRVSALGVPRAVGLTLSEEQAAHVRALELPGVSVEVRDWRHYEADRRFDGIVSIGAFEHFATPADSTVDKIARYREFFSRCRDWLHDGGALSVQTIAYGNMSAGQANSFIQREVFPDADLPTLAEITAAAEGLFEVRTLRNDRLDYAWTCEQWARRLRARRAEALALVGPEVTERYERYLKLSALGFRMGKIGLLRIVLDPHRHGYFVGRRDR
ncbi:MULTISPECIES: class I SAM-dependent methyltransferase [Nocardia]|uniref:class I SAM-dependent methyltransferase n=1 Tax=Nocardia TaxID=1817 RepID=UPI000BF02344|nr:MULTISPECIES: class I SAM-dependent methyltransferase [Nocardia]MBF6183919.1 class I SAM-dependent methyltransferase [Nocardia farcinica]MBF6270484.1 class I SAM-dependent methyltransferase [Nocardia farcinica]MBF6292862.1 class I SAM-dependent methyltransferase [Nocardia farcinica]MBF6309762.1 class I SAM-dependent methyltransferase [Nocardia farcinica]MBF6379157.1 class I SAM-dependent methyltransferase [Nocardia farcinica]